MQTQESMLKSASLRCSKSCGYGGSRFKKKQIMLATSSHFKYRGGILQWLILLRRVPLSSQGVAVACVRLAQRTAVLSTVIRRGVECVREATHMRLLIARIMDDVSEGRFGAKVMTPCCQALSVGHTCEVCDVLLRFCRSLHFHQHLTLNRLLEVAGLEPSGLPWRLPSCFLSGVFRISPVTPTCG